MSDDDSPIAPLFSTVNDSSYYIQSLNKTLHYHPRLLNHTNSNESESKLFANNLWPGSLVLSDYLCDNPQLVISKICIELGAAFALPSMVALTLGAEHVVVTDYPATNLIDNINTIFAENNLTKYTAIPCIWGDESDALLNSSPTGRFDVILIAEPLWKDTYTQHDNLLRSLSYLISEHTIVYLSFAHRPTDTHTPSHDLELLVKSSEKYHWNVSFLLSSLKYCDVGETIPIEVLLYSINK